MDTNKPAQSTETQSKGPQTKTGTDTAPNPARFTNFTLLKDETGFRIPNCDRIFEFDVYGGWFDEYKNYYNADGQPQTPPEYDDEDDIAGFDDDEAERLAREYDVGDDDYDDDLNHYDNIYLNVENKRVLQNYLKDQEINVEMRNINFNVSEDEFEKFLSSKKIEWLEFEFEFDNRDRFRGVVYLTLDKPNAQKLIEFNGQRIFGRDIQINVMRPDEEEEDVHAVGINVAATQEKAEEKKSTWRAEVPEKGAETPATTQAQPKTETQKPAQTNPAPVSESDKGQSSQQQQQKSSGFERNQNYNANQRQGNNQYNNQRGQGYGDQQYPNYGKNQQGGYPKNNYYNNQKGQNYQPGCYPQYPVHEQMPKQMSGQYQGGYPYGYPSQQQNQYMYQQYQNFPQQQWNQGYSQPYSTQQQNYPGQNDVYPAPQQNVPNVSGFETLPGQSQAGGQSTAQAQATEEVNEGKGSWAKPLAKKKQAK